MVGQGVLDGLMIFEIVIHLMSRRIGCFDSRHKLLYLRKQLHAQIGSRRYFLRWGGAFIGFWILILKQLPNMCVHNKLLSLNPVSSIWWTSNLSDSLFGSSNRWRPIGEEPRFSSISGGCIVAWHLYWTTNVMSYTSSINIICRWRSTWNQIGMTLGNTDCRCCRCCSTWHLVVHP